METWTRRTDIKSSMSLIRASILAASTLLGIHSEPLAAGQKPAENLWIASLRDRADAGDPEGQYELGLVYEFGEDGVPVDLKQAVAFYRKAAEQGFAAAQSALGVMYDSGRGVERNDNLALEWYFAAAAQGDAKAQNNLGYRYEHGKGLGLDSAEAAGWYAKAAASGSSLAEANLGFLYARGVGVPQDYQEALKLFRSAAEKGDAKGIYGVSVIYGRGLGVPKDRAESLIWARRAAEMGQSGAAYTLAVLYHFGDGLPLSEVDSLKWLFIAVARASREGDELPEVSPGRWQQELDTMENGMSREHVETARKQAQAWLDTRDKMR